MNTSHGGGKKTAADTRASFSAFIHYLDHKHAFPYCWRLRQQSHHGDVKATVPAARAGLPTNHSSVHQSSGISAPCLPSLRGVSGPSSLSRPSLFHQTLCPQNAADMFLSPPTTLPCIHILFLIYSSRSSCCRRRFSPHNKTAPSPCAVRALARPPGP